MLMNNSLDLSLEIENILKKEVVFSKLDDNLLKILIKHTLVIEVKQNTELAEQDKDLIAHNTFIVLNGRIVTAKIPKGHAEITHPKHCMAFRTEDMVNAMALIGSKEAISIFAVHEPTRLLIINVKALQTEPKWPSILKRILPELVTYFYGRMSHSESVLGNLNWIAKQSIDKSLEEAKMRINFGIFIVHTIIILCVYTISLRGLETIELDFGDTSIVTTTLIFLAALAFFYSMLKTKVPLADFGLTTKDWRRAVFEGVVSTIPLFIFLVLLKLVVIKTVPKFHALPLFEINTGFNSAFHVTSWKQMSIMVIYIIFAPLQEFIVRGGLQGSLYQFLVGSKKKRAWVAIFLANLIFITFHSHISLLFAFATFVPGLVWGWLYSRHRTLIGVSVSHILLGLSILFVMGVTEIAGG